MFNKSILMAVVFGAVLAVGLGRSASAQPVDLTGTTCPNCTVKILR